MTKERLEELGWQFDDFWANRALFSKKDSKIDRFAIFEHSGDWGIMDPYSKGFTLIYCNMSDEEIEQYINYINTIEDIVDHPKDYTYYDYFCCNKNINDFVDLMRGRS